MNTVNEGFVDEPQHYPYSSAAAYAGMPSVLSVEIICGARHGSQDLSRLSGIRACSTELSD